MKPWRASGSEQDNPHIISPLSSPSTTDHPACCPCFSSPTPMLADFRYACRKLAAALGATVAGFAFLVELGFLDGRKKLADSEIRSLIRY